jgi:hypothetical protein
VSHQLQELAQQKLALESAAASTEKSLRDCESKLVRARIACSPASDAHRSDTVSGAMCRRRKCQRSTDMCVEPLGCPCRVGSLT